MYINVHFKTSLHVSVAESLRIHYSPVIVCYLRFTAGCNPFKKKAVCTIHEPNRYGSGNIIISK